MNEWHLSISFFSFYAHFLSFFSFSQTKRNENPPLPCTWAEQPASAAILVLVLVLALLPSSGNAIASTRICLSHVGNAICQQVTADITFSLHIVPLPSRTPSSVFFLNWSCDFLRLNLYSTSNHHITFLYFITTPDFQATSQSLEIWWNMKPQKEI